MVLSHMAYAKEKPSLTYLKNGLGVLVQEDRRFPLVSLRLYVRAGSAYETPKQAGISHLLEHMVFKGTARRAKGEVAKTIEGAGGYLNAATSFDYTVYIIDLPADNWDLGLDVLQDMIWGAALDPEELEQEKKVVLSELERGEDNPSQRMFKAIQPLVFADTGYERPIIGHRSTVTAITRKDIQDYIAKFYQPQSMLAVVVGDVDKDKVLAKVEDIFGHLTNTEHVVPNQSLPLPKVRGPHIKVERGPWSKAYVSVAFPLPGMHAAQSPGLDLLAYLLGGDETSRLYRKFKYDLGLVDSISASAMGLNQVGILYIHATLDEKNFPDFFEKLSTELASLDATPFSRQELERARLNISVAFQSTNETLGGLASKLGRFQFFKNSLDVEENYLSRLGNVEVTELQTLANTYLQGNALVSAVLLPASAKASQSEMRQDPEKSQELTAKARTLWQKKAQPVQKTALADTAGKQEVIDLGQGCTLILLPDNTLPFTAVNLTFQGGNLLLSAKEQGLAALTAKALTFGTKKLSATAYDDFLSGRAAEISARAGRDTLSVHAKFPARFAKEILPVFEDTVLEPAFASSEIKRAKKEAVAAIKQEKDLPTALAFSNLFPLLYKDSGYSFLLLGDQEQVLGFEEGQIANFWQKQVSNPFTLAVAGQFLRGDVVALGKKLARSSKGVPLKFQTPAQGLEQKKTLTMPGRNQSHIVIAFPVPGVHHKDSAGLDLLRQTLAGQGGLLFTELRDKKGLGYTVTALLWQAPSTGFLAFYIGTYPGKTKEAIKGFQDVTKALHQQVLPTDAIKRAQNMLAGNYFRNRQSLNSRAKEAARLTIHNLDISHNTEQIKAAQTLTPKDIQDLARKYLRFDKAYTLMVTP